MICVQPAIVRLASGEKSVVGYSVGELVCAAEDYEHHVQDQSTELPLPDSQNSAACQLL